MRSLSKAAGIFHNYTGNVKCNDLNNGGGSSLGEKGWDYQVLFEWEVFILK